MLNSIYSINRSAFAVPALPRQPPVDPRAADQPAAPPGKAALLSWQDLIRTAHHLLRIPRHPGFLDAIQMLHADLLQTLEPETDSALLALLYPPAIGPQPYSASHAVISAVAATLAAHCVVAWGPDERRIAGLAALTMNLAMAAQQDELAEQRQGPTAAQRSVMQGHARRSAQLLVDAGVDDAVWLEAVTHHHDINCGALAARSTGQQVARLLQRCDLFVGQLRPLRPAAAPASAAQAVQAAFLGEDGAPDEAGMHLVRALGIYPPGCAVRLAGGEIGIVVRRGLQMNTPWVARIADAQGQPCVPALMATASEGAAAVARALAPAELSLQVAPEPLLALIQPGPPGSEGVA